MSEKQFQSELTLRELFPSEAAAAPEKIAEADTELPAQSLESSAPAPEMKGEELIRGFVVRIGYASPETGFHVLGVRPDSSHLDGKRITVVGRALTPVHLESEIVARGQWITHDRFGLQFKAASITEVEPSDAVSIVRYLGSGAVKGIGPALAQRIVDTFGDDTLRILDKEPERLAEIIGIGAVKQEEISTSWNDARALRELQLFFTQHGIPAGLSNRIITNYGARAIEVVKNNPYVLARDMFGVGFLTADSVAMKLGYPPDSLYRVASGVLYVLRKAADDGHCYLPVEHLVMKAGELLSLNDRNLIEAGITRAAFEGDIVQDEDRVYSEYLYRAESEMTGLLSQRIRIGKPSPPVQASQLEHSLAIRRSSVSSTAGGQEGVLTLSPEQMEAVRKAAESTIVVITGGPGCGKTTLVQSLVQLFQASGLRVKLAAPTGRAAYRMSELCDLPGSTIHRMLKFDPVSRQFTVDESNPLDADVVIVDESSMIDVPLALALLRALRPDCRLVIVGDADQLPSVGPGLFLSDLLAVEGVPRVRLTRLFRRAEESLITTIAYQINAGEVPDIPVPSGSSRTDAYFLEESDPTRAGELVERVVVDQLPRKFGFSPTEILVLSPMNQGDLGTISLNRRLQARLIPEKADAARVRTALCEFRVGDRVCQRVNNYSLDSQGVFNGDQGVIIGMDTAEQTLYVRLWDGREVEYKGESVQQLDLAYAITIHRSQGSEIPAVVLVLHDQHGILLDKQLLYTAVTRAKKLLIIVGSKKALVRATRKNRGSRRYSWLAERLRKQLAEARNKHN